MRAFVESLKRLYEAGKITEGKVLSLEDEGKITHEENIYIIGKNNIID